MSADPLRVACPYFSCGAAPGKPCVAAHLKEYAGGYWDWRVDHTRKPHAARVRATEKKGEDRG